MPSTLQVGFIAGSRAINSPKSSEALEAQQPPAPGQKGEARRRAAYPHRGTRALRQQRRQRIVPVLPAPLIRIQVRQPAASPARPRPRVGSLQSLRQITPLKQSRTGRGRAGRHWRRRQRMNRLCPTPPTTTTQLKIYPPPAPNRQLTAQRAARALRGLDLARSELECGDLAR